MEKVLLISLVGGLREAGKYNRAMAPFYLKNFAMADKRIAKSFDIEIMLFDLEDNEEIILKNTYRANPSIAAFSLFFWSTERSLNIARKLKMVSPETTIIAGGPQVTEELFTESPWLDFAVRGEGEKVFRDFLLARVGGPTPPPVPGVMHRKNGKAVTDVDFNIMEELAELQPLSACGDFTDYRAGSPEKKFPLEISRGCPFKCSYCSWNLHKVRFIPIGIFEENVRYLVSNLPKRREIIIDFIDSYLDMDTEHLKEALRVLVKYKRPHVKYRGYFLFRSLDDEAADLLEEANFKYLYIGLQSSDPGLAKTLNRKWFRKESMDRALELGERFHVTVDLILGLPGDTYAKFRETVKALWERGFDNIISTRLRVIPGTAFFADPKYGIAFDRRPPHMAFDVESFPLKDVFRASRFAANFTVFRKLFRRSDFDIIKNIAGIDPFDICANIHEKDTRWNDLVIKAGPGCNDVSFESDIAYVITDYLKKYYDLPKSGSSLEELISLRRAEFIMREQMEEMLNTLPAYSPATHGDAAKRRLCLPGYEKISINRNVIVQPSSPEWGKRWKSQKTFFLINNYSEEGIETIESANPNLVEVLFRLLGKPVMPKKALELMSREIPGLGAAQLNSFLDMLIEKGALLYGGGSA